MGGAPLAQEIGIKNIVEIHNYLTDIREIKGTYDIKIIIDNIKDNFSYRYLNDLDGLKNPETLEKDKVGDCEDFTLYVLAKLRKVGVPLSSLGLVVIYPIQNVDSEVAYFGHMAPVYYDGKTWKVLELTFKEKESWFNWSFETYLWYSDLFIQFKEMRNSAFSVDS